MQLQAETIVTQAYKVSLKHRALNSRTLRRPLTVQKLTCILYQIGKPGILGNSGNTGTGQKPLHDKGGDSHHPGKGTESSANKNGIFLYITNLLR